MPDAPRWLLEAFRDGVDQFAHDERPLMGYMPYAGAWPGCFLANFDPAKLPCSGQQERYERFHFIPRQRVEKLVWELLREALIRCPICGGHGGGACEGCFGGTRVRMPRDWLDEFVHLAAWDPRNGGYGCEHHHRRYDSHAHSPRAPKITIPAFNLPEHVDQFVISYGLEPEAERRFDGYRVDGDRAYLWGPSRR